MALSLPLATFLVTREGPDTVLDVWLDRMHPWTVRYERRSGGLFITRIVERQEGP